MRNILIPPAPTASAKSERDGASGNTLGVSLAGVSPLDAAFLKRVYISLLIVGALAMGWAFLARQSVPVLVSLGAGYLLAAFLLKIQEVTVRGLLRPGGAEASLAKMGALLLMPVKFIGVAALLAGLNVAGLLAPAAMAIGFSVALAVVLAKLGGWFLMRALRQGQTKVGQSPAGRRSAS